MKLRRFVKLTITSLAIISMFFVNTSIAATNSNTFTPQQEKNIQSIVHDYLIQNPEILLQASVELRKKMEAKQQSDAMVAIKANKKDLFNTDQNLIAGNPNGSVTMVEFFDYQCPHCKAMGQAINDLIKKNPNLRIVFKEWPIFGGGSLDATKAAIAASKQSKYYKLHSALLKANNPMTKDIIFKLAKQAGLNIAKLKRDMDDPSVMQQIKANFDLARKLKLVGTPAFILTNKTGDQFKFIPGQATEEALQKSISKLSK